ncbi:hypothetical protein PAHAL_4G012300 [Panicum hallii]|uniref:Uncharacterized protein n=1 Tax=Panicum hallii TaxID=206008 RepID=A0A2T8JBE1_9POAL|nr:hypothetical protein PAHAL_4G012300 [Panicum hallii]
MYSISLVPGGKKHPRRFCGTRPPTANPGNRSSPSHGPPPPHPPQHHQRALDDTLLSCLAPPPPPYAPNTSPSAHPDPSIIPPQAPSLLASSSLRRPRRPRPPLLDRRAPTRPGLTFFSCCCVGKESFPA